MIQCKSREMLKGQIQFKCMHYAGQARQINPFGVNDSKLSHFTRKLVVWGLYFLLIFCTLKSPRN